MKKLYRPCPICHQDAPQFLYQPSKSPGPVARCRDCGFVYISAIQSPQALIENGPVGIPPDSPFTTSANMADLKGSWELTLIARKLLEKPALRVNALDALGRLQVYQEPPGRILDFGCGWGFFLSIASECGWQPYGLEPLPGHATYARTEFGATVVTDTLRDSTFPANYFSVATAFQVFEHLPNPAADLRRLHIMLEPGGVILVEVPNIDTWSVRLFGERHRHFVPDHINFFSKETLSRLLEKSGFRVIERYYPRRCMSLHHLVNTWGGRYLPMAIHSLLSSFVRKTGLSQKLLRLGVGDILAMIGRKVC